MNVKRKRSAAAQVRLEADAREEHRAKVPLIEAKLAAATARRSEVSDAKVMLALGETDVTAVRQLAAEIESE